MSATVLVIDDEPPIRNCCAWASRPRLFHLGGAGRRTALDVLKREGADLVILDLGLPDMRGMICCGPSVPNIRSAGGGPVEPDDEGGKVEALDLGGRLRHTKPFGMAELLARLRAALRHQLATQGESGPIFRVENPDRRSHPPHRPL